MASDVIPREEDFQFIQDRISSVENYMSDLCCQFNFYTNTTARLRDDGDKLAKTICAFASKELLNETLQSSLSKFSDILCAVQDYRDTEVQRLNYKVVMELSTYGHICKAAREEVKKHLALVEECKKKHNKKQKNAPGDQHSAGRQPIKNEADGVKLKYKLMKLINTFERRKLDDLKRVFIDFVHIELLFHTKAVELFTRAYREIERINTEEDMEEFKSRFRFPNCGPCMSFINQSLTQRSPDNSNETSLSNSENNVCSNSKACEETDPKSFHSNHASSHVKKNTSIANSDDYCGSSLSEGISAAKAYESFKWHY